MSIALQEKEMTAPFAPFAPFAPLVRLVRRWPWEWTSLLLVLLVGLALRTWKLDRPTVWCDEAESAINALTILEHGLPVSHYLGLPIYENILTEPWPEHPEYEFRDSSYSRRGLAVYHGWLPLYSIAGSLKFFGIAPDTDPSNLKPLHDAPAIARRTVAARLPSALYGVLFLLLLYLTAREMYGRDAGWAALIAATISVPIVHASRQARYYAPTLALSMACCLLAWRMYARGRWMDFILGGLVFALLFHTHVLTFAIACAATATLVPPILRRRAGWRKAGVFAAIVTAGVLPWMACTGFLGTAHSVPKAIDALRLPDDLLAWPLERWPVSLVLLAGMGWIVLAHIADGRLGGRLPGRFVQPFVSARPAFYFLGGWVVLGFAMFMLLIPAASLFFQRLYLGCLGAGIVFGAMLFAAVGRAVGRRGAIVLSAVTFVLFVAINTRTGYSWRREEVWRRQPADLFAEMRRWNLKPGTRIYATPNEHLTLTFYSGVPVQSIAPVRKEFLDNHPGDIVLVECVTRRVPLTTAQVREAARRAGHLLTEADVAMWTDLISRAGVARLVRPDVQAVDPWAEQDHMPEFARTLLEWQRRESPLWSQRQRVAETNPAVFRGFAYDDHNKWWQIFFYRYVGLEQRSGPHLNYAQRIRRGRAMVLPSLWIVYQSPPLAPSRPPQRAAAR